MIGARASHRRRLSTLDSLMTMRIGMSLSPIEIPPADELRKALVAVAGQGPNHRLGLVLADDRHWEVLGQQLAERAEEVIRSVPDATLNPRQWLEDNRIADLPVQFAVAGNQFGVIADHRLLDGFLGLRLPSLLIDVANGEEIPTYGTLTARPLTTALWNTFGLRPAAWRKLYRHLRDNRKPGGPPPVVTAATPPPRSVSGNGTTPAVRHLKAVMGRAPLAELRRWARGRIGFSAALLLVAAGGLRDVGLEIAPRGVMVVDLRRYLPEGVTTLGNFITGVPIPLLGQGTRPETLDAWIEEALEVGRPLAATTLTVTKAAVRSLRRRRQPAVVELSQDPAVVSISNDGLLRGIDKLPWLAEPADRSIEVVGDAPESNSLGIITYMAAGRLHLTLSFQANRYDPAEIARALELMANEPVRLLQTYYGS